MASSNIDTAIQHIDNAIDIIDSTGSNLSITNPAAKNGKSNIENAIAYIDAAIGIIDSTPNIATLPPPPPPPKIASYTPRPHKIASYTSKIASPPPPPPKIASYTSEIASSAPPPPPQDEIITIHVSLMPDICRIMNTKFLDYLPYNRSNEKWKNLELKYNKNNKQYKITNEDEHLNDSSYSFGIDKRHLKIISEIVDNINNYSQYFSIESNVLQIKPIKIYYDMQNYSYSITTIPKSYKTLTIVPDIQTQIQNKLTNIFNFFRNSSSEIFYQLSFDDEIKIGGILKKKKWHHQNKKWQSNI